MPRKKKEASEANEVTVEEKKVRTRKKKTADVKEEEKVAKIENEELKEMEGSKDEKKTALELLKEKAKKLESKVDVINSEEIKEQIKEKKIVPKTLIPLEDYIKSGTYIGTRVITPAMRKYVYKRRADGLAVLNTLVIDESVQKAIEFLSKFDPKDAIIVCKREAGWNAAELFSKVTGIRVFTKKYPPGILTNIKLDIFFEPKLVIICDPWLDKNALNDAIKTNRQILALCDTNNFIKEIHTIIPCNNKSNKSLGLILYHLAEGYLKAKGIKTKMPKLKDFIGEDL